MKKIFVYGSLRKDSFNYKNLLEGKIFNRVMGQTTGNLFHLENKGYPALISGNNQVIGEIITIVSDELIYAIDKIEHYDSNMYEKCEYLRKPIAVKNLETEVIELLDAYVYNINSKNNHKDLLKFVPSGDWLKYIES